MAVKTMAPIFHRKLSLRLIERPWRYSLTTHTPTSILGRQACKYGECGIRHSEEIATPTNPPFLSILLASYFLRLRRNLPK